MIQKNVLEIGSSYVMFHFNVVSQPEATFFKEIPSVTNMAVMQTFEIGKIPSEVNMHYL
jgi:hypothetical protein